MTDESWHWSSRAGARYQWRKCRCEDWATTIDGVEPGTEHLRERVPGTGDDVEVCYFADHHHEVITVVKIRTMSVEGAINNAALVIDSITVPCPFIERSWLTPGGSPCVGDATERIVVNGRVLCFACPRHLAHWEADPGYWRYEHSLGEMPRMVPADR